MRRALPFIGSRTGYWATLRLMSRATASPSPFCTCMFWICTPMLGPCWPWPNPLAPWPWSGGANGGAVCPALLGAVGCAPAKPTPHTGHATGVLHQAVNGGWRSEWRRADARAEATAERSEPAKKLCLRVDISG